MSGKREIMKNGIGRKGEKKYTEIGGRWRERQSKERDRIRVCVRERGMVGGS